VTVDPVLKETSLIDPLCSVTDADGRRNEGSGVPRPCVHCHAHRRAVVERLVADYTAYSIAVV